MNTSCTLVWHRRKRASYDLTLMPCATRALSLRQPTIRTTLHPFVQLPQIGASLLHGEIGKMHLELIERDANG